MKRLVTTRTPLRVSLFGGGSDLPEISRKQQGSVLSFGIKQYVYVTVKQHSGLFHERYRLQYSSTERVDRVDDIKNEIIRATLLYFGIDEPLVVNTFSDMPASSGLGSSSSFTVGLVKAMNAMYNLGVSTSSIAEKSYQIERSIKGSAVGRQDAYAASIGGFNLFRFGTTSCIVPVVDLAQLESLLPYMKLYWTGVQRDAGKILRAQADMSENKLPIYSKLSALAEESFKLFNESRVSVVELGERLNRNTELKYQLCGEISSPSIKAHEDSLRAGGAIATKLLGAGGGGFILAIYSDVENAEKGAASSDMISLELNIDYTGSDVILKG